MEVATLFGAVQEYILRGYKEKILVNAFPSECFTPEGDKAFDEYFGDYSGRGIIEILEYPELSLDKWVTKRESLERKDLEVSLDDYGSGNNDMVKVDLLRPQIVKLDRSLISGVDHDEEKKIVCGKTISELHAKDKMVVAEGVETKEEFECLVSLGADLFQGYYLGRPL